MRTFLKEKKVVFDSLVVAFLLCVAIVKLFFENDPGERNWNLFSGIIFLLLAVARIAIVVIALRSKKQEENVASDINKN